MNIRHGKMLLQVASKKLSYNACVLARRCVNNSSMYRRIPYRLSFKAEINFAEESGVVQVETFGVSLNAEGTCFYGMQVKHGGV